MPLKKIETKNEKNYDQQRSPGRSFKRAQDPQRKDLEDMMERKRKKDRYKTPGFLTGGQTKLDKNKNGRIDAEDFKMLRADKPMKAAMGKSVRGYGAARTSGSGLLDEQMAPGKVMNAKKGKMTELKKDYKKPVNPFQKKGKMIGKAAGRAGIPIAIAIGIGKGVKAMKDKLMKKKMGGGMMNKPMGYKSGTMVMARGCKLGRKKATKIT